MQLLIGSILGFIIAVLIGAVVLLVGALRHAKKDIDGLTFKARVFELTAQAGADAANRKLAESAKQLEEARAGQKQPFVIHFTDEQIMQLSEVLAARVQQLIPANGHIN